MSAPLLSICIATYNRARFIGETLNSILPQLEDDVELLVADGASTDNTGSIVLEIAKKDPRVRYVRLPAKGGVDQDYDKAVELARGEYCWLFTDDDLLKPGAVAAVKKAAREGNDLIIVNAEVRDLGLAVILQRRKIAIHQDKAYPPGDLAGLFSAVMPYLSFIGAIIIRRSLWLGRDRASYFGTEFAHVGVIFQEALPAPAFVIAEPYIISRWGNAQWTQRSFNIWMFKWPGLVWSFKNISAEAKLRVTPKEPWRSLKKLYIERDEGRYDLRIFRQHFSGKRVNIAWKFCAWTIAALPRTVAARVHAAYGRVKRFTRIFLPGVI